MVGTKYKIGSTNSVLKPVSTNYFLKLQPLRTGFYTLTYRKHPASNNYENWNQRRWFKNGIKITSATGLNIYQENFFIEILQFKLTISELNYFSNA